MRQFDNEEMRKFDNEEMRKLYNPEAFVSGANECNGSKYENGLIC